jgi:hypothetical protein
VSGPASIETNGVSAMRNLVDRLSEQDGPVSFEDTEEPLDGIRRRIVELEHVAIRFTATTGGTVLAVTVDPTATDLDGADFEAGTGSVHVEGTLVLDYVPVRCVATIDLASRMGTGRLVPDRRDGR